MMLLSDGRTDADAADDGADGSAGASVLKRKRFNPAARRAGTESDVNFGGSSLL